MDEKTHRINGVLPEKDFLWLTAVAKRNRWPLSRALRWAVGEARKAQAVSRSKITAFDVVA